MFLIFNKFFVLFFSLFFLVSFYNISYAERTVNINVEIDKWAFVAANGSDSNNYSTPFVLDSNNNTLNLNVTPRVDCYICGGTGQGEIVDLDNPVASLLGDVRNNTLNINCDIGADIGECILMGGTTSNGAVSRNTVNVFSNSNMPKIKFLYAALILLMSFCGCAKDKAGRQPQYKPPTLSYAPPVSAIDIPPQELDARDCLDERRDQLDLQVKAIETDREELTAQSIAIDIKRRKLDEYRDGIDRALQINRVELDERRDQLNASAQNLGKYHKQIDDEARSLLTFSDDMKAFARKHNIDISDLPALPDRPDLLMPQPPT
jgi:hypothetical protein